MRSTSFALAAVVSILEVVHAAPTPQNSGGSAAQSYTGHTSIEPPNPVDSYYISLGPRPYYLINNMTDSPLKRKLQSCANGPFQVTDFTIGHRGGATLQIPEESVENAMAGARFGAGILECDTSLTADKGLVCRHSLCDLATTTDILLHPNLAAKCAVPFKPANGTHSASAICCTTDITMAEYLTLCSKMDGFNASATNVKDYQIGAPSFRTELYDTCGQVQTLESYIDLVNSFPGYRNFTPELKSGADDPVTAQYAKFPAGYTQEDYARQFANTFIKKGIDPARVWMQSFNPPDIFLWLAEFPQFGRQAVYLDESGDDPVSYAAAVAALPSIKAKGVNIIAPPFNYLIMEAGPDNQTIVPAPYATAAKAVGLDIITWTFERSGPLDLVKATGQYYYESIADAVHTDGQVYEVLDILVQQVGIKGIFTDWAATVTYYANCFGLHGPNSADYQPKAGTSGAMSSASKASTMSSASKASTMSSASKASTATSKAPTGTGAPVSQISDGQPQAPTGKPVSQISDGQVQAPTGKTVSQISDGQVQAPTSKATSQAPTGRPVSQISDGQPQATTSHT